VTVSDAGGQEVFHTFALAPSAGGVPAAAADPKEPAPGIGLKPAEPARPAPAAPVAAELVRPAAEVLPIKPTAAADGATVKLPAAADAACVGGGGRFLIFRLPKTRQLAVFDVTAGRGVKYLPLAEDGALFAAGATKLYVLNPSAN